MRKILICDDDTAVRMVVGMCIESEYDNELVYASSADEAIDILKKDMNIGLVLCDYNMPRKKGSAVFNYNAEATNLPFVMLTGDMIDSFPDIEHFKTNQIQTILHKPWKEEQLYDIIKITLGDIEEDDFIEEASSSEYKKVRTHTLFRYLNNAECFDKINDIEYEKINTDLIENKKVFFADYDYVYILQNDYNKLLSSINSKMESYKKSMGALKEISVMSTAILDKVVTNAEMLDMTIEELEDFSSKVSEEVVSMQETKGIGHLVESTLAQEDYFSGHALLGLQISYKLTKKMGFAEKSIIKKLTQACLLHDAFFEKTSFSKYGSKSELESSSLSDEDKNAVLLHPDTFALMLAKYKYISSDVLDAIKSHHYRIDGDGYGSVINIDSISTLSAIVNLSLQTSDMYYKYGYSNESNQKIIKQIKDYQGQGNFDFVSKKLIEILN